MFGSLAYLLKCIRNASFFEPHHLLLSSKPVGAKVLLCLNQSLWIVCFIKTHFQAQYWTQHNLIDWKPLATWQAILVWQSYQTHSLCKSASEKGKPQYLAIFHDSNIVILKPQPLPFSIIHIKVILNIHQHMHTGLHVQIMLVYDEKCWLQSTDHTSLHFIGHAALKVWTMLVTKGIVQVSKHRTCSSSSI